MKVKPYQFGLATISGFRDHSNVTRLRTDRNQLVNIYLMPILAVFLGTSYLGVLMYKTSWAQAGFSV